MLLFEDDGILLEISAGNEAHPGADRQSETYSGRDRIGGIYRGERQAHDAPLHHLSPRHYRRLPHRPFSAVAAGGYADSGGSVEEIKGKNAGYDRRSFCF